MTRLGFPLSCLSFFRTFSVQPVVTAFTLRKALRLRNVPFFFSLLPRSRLAGSCFRSVGLFSSWLEWWASTCGGFRVSLSVGFFNWWILPDSRALGAGLPGLSGSYSIELLPPSRSFRLRAVPAAAPVHHTLRQPSFPRKLRLRGCRWCLRLRILSGWSPLGCYPCSVSIFSLIFSPGG